MIPKILKNATTFNGIDYNTQKMKEGVAEFVGCKNMAFNEYSDEDIKNFFSLICEGNNTVKNVQFHASVSCKGREYSKEQLKEIGEQYMEKMGYTNSPYVMYFHKDTENNHIHIVAPRVDFEGNKVDDSFEKKRSFRVMQEIMGQDIKTVVENDLKEALKYNFSNISQMKLLLENKGWSINDKKPEIEIYKGGSKQFSFDKSLVNDKLSTYKADKDRLKQLGAIIDKYSKGLNPSQLKIYLRENHGVELVFHRNNKHEIPYGYTIIDHAKKNVFKGSEVYSLNKLLENKPTQEKINASEDIINSLLNQEKQTYKALKENLRPYEMQLKGKNIYINGIKQSVFKLPENLYKELRYNDRVIDANKFNVSTQEEAKILAKMYFINAKDVQINIMADKKDYLLNEITSIIGNQKQIEKSNWGFFETKDKIFLVDKESFNITDITHFKDYVSAEREVGQEKGLENVDSFINDVSTSKQFLDALFDSLNQNFGSDEHDSRQKKRKQQR